MLPIQTSETYCPLKCLYIFQYNFETSISCSSNFKIVQQIGSSSMHMPHRNLSSHLMNKVNSDVDLVVWHKDAQLARPTYASSSGLHLKTQLPQPHNLPFCPFKIPGFPAKLKKNIMHVRFVFLDGHLTPVKNYRLIVILCIQSIQREDTLIMRQPASQGN